MACGQVDVVVRRGVGQRVAHDVLARQIVRTDLRLIVQRKNQMEVSISRVDEQRRRHDRRPLELADVGWLDLPPRGFLLHEIARRAAEKPVLVVEIEFAADLVPVVELHRRLGDEVRLVVQVGRRGSIGARDAEHLRADVEAAIRREEPRPVSFDGAAEIAVQVVDVIDRVPFRDPLRAQLVRDVVSLKRLLFPVDARAAPHLVAARFRHGVHVHTAGPHFRRRAVGHHVDFGKAVLVEVEGGRAAIPARPVQLQAVHGVFLLPPHRPMDGHGGLLRAAGAADVEPALSRSGHLFHRGPDLPRLRDRGEQGAVEVRAFARALDIDARRLAGDFHRLADGCHLHRLINGGHDRHVHANVLS